jgi:hypothetical protein
MIWEIVFWVPDRVYVSARTRRVEDKSMEDIFPLIQVLSDRDTRRVLNISDRTAERLKTKGDYPVKTQLSDGRIGYRVCDIKEWLDKRRIAPSEQTERR